MAGTPPRVGVPKIGRPKVGRPVIGRPGGSKTVYDGTGVSVHSGDNLLLEGDMQSGADILLLDGDMQSGIDALLLDGVP